MYPQSVSSRLSQKSFPKPNLAATAVHGDSDDDQRAAEGEWANQEGGRAFP